MTIGERIKELRAEANLRQSELGKAIGFSGQVVSNVERGYSFPSTEFVNRSAACFGVPADYILGRTTSRYAVADPKEVSWNRCHCKPVKSPRHLYGLPCG